MRTKRAMLWVLLTVLLLSMGLPHAMALTSNEKRALYDQAMSKLEAYIEGGGREKGTLPGIADTFQELAGFEHSRFMRYYVSVLIKIENEEYDYELYTILDMLNANEGFKQYLRETLKGSAIGTVEELNLYALARQYEHEGKTELALEAYRQCLSFFGADERYYALQQASIEETYENAKALLNAGDYAGAYFLFASIAKYSDSTEWMNSIVNQLGYVPESPDDGLHPVSNLRVTESRGTRMTLSWSRSSHAAEYEVYCKKHSQTRWDWITTVTATSCTVSGLDENASYDFKVIAVIGRIKSAETILSDQKANAQATEKPAVTAAPTKAMILNPTQAPTPQPQLILNVTPSLGCNRLTWNAVRGATSYMVRRHTDNTSYSDFAACSETGYEDYWVTAGKRYYYTVVAYLSNGAAITSNEFAALSTTPAPTAKADTVLRKTIRITSIRYVQNKGIELKWQDMGKGVTYSVYRRWAKADQFSKIADVGSAVTYLDTFPHKGGYVYYYYIVAEDQYGYTIISETQHAQVQ